MSADPSSEPADEVRDRGQFEIGSDGVSAIVVGFDGSDPARDALAFAAGLTRREGARLLVVYVISPSALTGLAPQAAQAMRDAAHEQGQDLATEVTAIARSIGLAPEFVIAEGDPAREVEAVAERERADLIVVGRSSSRTHAVMGSVAVALVKHAQRPITVVP